MKQKMSEDEKMISHWRNERRNHCEFATQASYDDMHASLTQLRLMLKEKEISAAMAEAYLIKMYNYGTEGARRAVSVMEKKNEQDNISR